ncbi:GSCOCG00001543001-RA-CDS [Cotesia congregata]|nr:GSCOCG00001543001-RA-CDS [Cotesia congregata]
MEGHAKNSPGMTLHPSKPLPAQGRGVSVRTATFMSTRLTFTIISL